LRDTMGFESPPRFPIVPEFGIFFNCGEGLQSAISRSPTSFVGARSSFWNVVTGCDGLGRFHVSEIIQQTHPWWLLTDRKEKTSCLNREASRWCYRGSCADKKRSQEGRYLSEIFVRNRLAG